MYTCEEHITQYSYLQGIHGLVNNGGGEFLISLQRKVASSVALNVKVSLFAEDSVYAPFTLKFSITTILKIHVMQRRYLTIWFSNINSNVVCACLCRIGSSSCTNRDNVSTNF